MNSVLANGNTTALGSAAVLDQLISTVSPSGDLATVITAMGQLATQEEVSQAVSQTLPLHVGASAQAATNAMHSLNRIVQARTESNQGLSSGEEFFEDGYVWMKPFGAWAEQDNRGSVVGFESDSSGLAIGTDAVLDSRVRVGLVGTYAETAVDSKSVTAQRTDVDVLQLAAYGSYNVNARSDFNWQVDVGSNESKGHRSIRFGGLDRVATSDFDSLSMHAMVGAGYLFPVSHALSIAPAVRVDYARVETDGYTERGAGALNLRVDDSTYEELLLALETKAVHDLGAAWRVFGSAGVGFDFINDHAQAVSSFEGGGASFVASGIDVSPWVYRAGAGLSRQTERGVEFSLRYDAEGRTSGFLNQTLSARARIAF